MNNRPLLITIACGLLTAFFAVAPVGLGGLGSLLWVFMLVPLFVASLSLGPRLAGVAGLIALFLIAVLMGIEPAMLIAILFVGPALYVGYVAGLSRDDNGDGVLEWYPLSKILFQVALIVSIGFVLIGVVIGDRFSETSKELEELMRAAPTATQQVREMASSLVKAVPLLVPFSLILLYLYSMALGARFSRAIAASGQHGSSRPKDHLPSQVALPFGAAGIFGASIAVILIGGDSTLGVLGMVFAGAFGMMFIAVGLATIHSLTEGMAGRGVILFALYFVLLIFGVALVLLLILGLAETLLGLRARRAGVPPTT
ncbi:hypothetical protein [Ahrensia sp. R2A130]|uniref:hypothetical protein n=1 Tax=Ahrensia sp. R2A130 TaxID=744979 RepID=UPI0001E09C19|nr:hypothetical protein [Ahrensia sp. R2A130]EFL90616.1 putative membrane protein [Ahrensia sp. R2A130]